MERVFFFSFLELRENDGKEVRKSVRKNGLDNRPQESVAWPWSPPPPKCEISSFFFLNFISLTDRQTPG